ncbi:hypothetical protein GGQ80_000659 [Sphingomonas jinjuensis]|uniref:DUF4349 domain-containing protein n=1 Tax=Sphingomonas jinjuensis TaxID=535907 RepID=A0A840F8B6_9SPHN|nr:hypothetical protein [Sphingomonas jinjuensis]MBB4152771.1 hypothetical protein [Sphingomonas jinjuensis]
MRGRLLISSLLALAACSKAPDADDAADAPSAGPAVNVTAAPGVAFTYAYRFRLPAARIAGAQEAHAQACERLGVSRCRITGMRYQLAGENDIRAALEFKLDPTLARAFDKRGIDAITAAQGTLVDADITGQDAGAALARLATDRTRAIDEQRRLDAQLATAGSRASDRDTLQNQRADAARRLASLDDEAAGQRASLVTTPMSFAYDSGPAIAGFDASAPIRSAAAIAIGSAQLTLGVALGTAAAFGPPLLLLVLFWLGWRRLGPSILRRFVVERPAG